MRHLLQSFASTGTIQVINLLTGVLVARLLLPEGRGELAIVLLWPNLMLAIGFLGLDQAVIYHAARAQERSKAVFLAALLPGSLLILATAALGWCLLPWILEPEHGALVGLSRLFLLIAAPLHLANNLLMAVLLGRQKLLQWNLLRLVQPFCYLLALLALWAGEAVSVPHTLAAFIASSLAVTLTILPVGLRALRGAASAAPVAAVVGYAARVHLQALCMIVVRRIDQALISLYLLAADLGLYVVALALASALDMLSGTISMVAFPKVSGQLEDAGKRALFGRYFRFNLALLLAGALALWLFGEWLLALLFGAPFREAGPVLRILVLAAVIQGISGSLAFGYKAHDRVAVVNQGALLSLLAAGPAFALLLPAQGLTGAAWAVTLVYAIGALYMLLRLSGVLGIAPLKLLLPTADDAALLRHYRDALRARLR
ncbi:MAG: oligosaccharide flippase family protein [Rhodovibrionaceae bacterium]